MAIKEAQTDAQRAREQLGALEQTSRQWERERKGLEGQVQAAQDAAGKAATLNEKLKAESLDYKTQAERNARTIEDLQSKLKSMQELAFMNEPTNTNIYLSNRQARHSNPDDLLSLVVALGLPVTSGNIELLAPVSRDESWSVRRTPGWQECAV